MPLYTFQCTSCGQRAEFLVTGHDYAPTTCPQCSQPTLEREFKPFAVGASTGARSLPECATGDSCCGQCPRAFQ